jgi:molybdate transport system substrate-binding protein
MNTKAGSVLKVLTTGILKGAFDIIANRFEADTGHRVTMSWGPSTGTSPEASPVRVRSGEAVDVLIMVSTSMDNLVASGHFAPLSRRDVAVSRIGIAVKEGQAIPDISTPAALRQTLLGVHSIGFSEGASGTYVSTVLLEKLGIAQAVQPKCHVVLGRKFVGASVAEGEVEIGIQQISELYLESGITVVGALAGRVAEAQRGVGGSVGQSHQRRSRAAVRGFSVDAICCRGDTGERLDLPATTLSDGSGAQHFTAGCNRPMRRRHFCAAVKRADDDGLDDA